VRAAAERAGERGEHDFIRLRAVALQQIRGQSRGGGLVELDLDPGVRAGVDARPLRGRCSLARAGGQ
jgi:hypothetical protein